MGTLLFCLALNIGVGIYLHLWQPITNLVKAFQMSRQIAAWRIAGLLVLILMVAVVPVHAQQKVKADSWAWNAQTGVVQYSDGDDILVAKYAHAATAETTGYPALDNALRYVWNNCGKLMILFGLLAIASLLNSKLKAQNVCYGDVLREEAADRWEEENGDEMHNPFDAPEGMQPATQYIPVRTKR